MKQNQYTLLFYIYPYHCFTANIYPTPLQAIIAVKCHLSLILSGHRRVYLANCVWVSEMGRAGPCVLCAFDIFLNKNISQIQQCHMVPAGRQLGGGCYEGRGAATTHVSRAKWEMIKASVWLENCTCSSCCPHMERVCVCVCVLVRVCTPSGTSSAATCNIQQSQADVRSVHWANAVQNCSCSTSWSSKTSSAAAGK